MWERAKENPKKKIKEFSNQETPTECVTGAAVVGATRTEATTRGDSTTLALQETHLHVEQLREQLVSHRVRCQLWAELCNVALIKATNGGTEEKRGVGSAYGWQ